MAFIPQADFTAAYVGDVPPSPTTLFFYDELGNPNNINGFDTVTVEIIDPAGVATTLSCQKHDGNGLHVTWDTVTLFEVPGVFSLNAMFEDAGGVIVSAEPFRFVVQDVDGWLSLEQTRQQWPDAPTDDVFLHMLLETAKTQVISYAPVIGVENIVPNNYRHGQLLQARALYTASITSPSENVGIGDMQIRVFPLDWTIRAVLRPKTARPVVA